MPVPDGIDQSITRLHDTLRSETAGWRQAYQDDLVELRKDKVVAERELRQSLTLLETRFAEERRRLEIQEDHNTRNFSEFLDSIDEIKANLLAYYPDMPKALAVMIHHHTAELLKEAWHSPSARERLKRQNRFTDLMLAITEDLAALGREGEGQALPERTLACIRKDRKQLPQW